MAFNAATRLALARVSEAVEAVARGASSPNFCGGDKAAPVGVPCQPAVPSAAAGRRAPHEPKPRGVPRGEEDVGDAHRLALRGSTTDTVIPRLVHLVAEEIEALFGDRGKERLLVREVMVRSSVRYAGELDGGTQSKPVHPVLSNQSDGRFDERAA